MNKYGKFTEPGIIYFERLLPGPIERIWEYLTDSEKRGLWLASGEMDLRIGGKVELNFYHASLSPHNDPIPEKYQNHTGGSTQHERITKLDPPRLLGYTWGSQTEDKSEVTFELIPQDEKVLLILTHRRLGDDRETLLSVAGGWHTHLDILVDKLNDREPKPFWEVNMKVEEEYGRRLDNKM